MSEELLPYYNSELAYLRQLGDDFSRSFPKIAGRLRLNSRASDDPHVERLIQSFAFLTARIRKKLDDDFPEISQSLLHILHPNYLAPIPPLSVVQFQLDKTAGKLTTAYNVPRHSRLETEPVDGEPCRFQTCYDTTLWPLRLTEAGLTGPPFRAPQVGASARARSVLKLRLECLNSQLPIRQLKIPSLRFYLHGQRQFVHELYEVLFNNSLQVAVARDADDPTPQILPADCLQPVGFGQNENLLPHSARTPPCYQLLREYFTFPEKFLFVEVDLSAALRQWPSGQFDVYIYLNRRVDELEQFVSQETFRLGCTPIVNLFQMTAEPIRLTHDRSEYAVIPDARRAAALEPFSIDRVTAVDGDGVEEDVSPLYSLKHARTSQENGKFWFSQRRPGRMRDGVPDPGTDLHLSLVDLEMNPCEAPETVLTVETTCLNRDLVSRLPFGGGHPRFFLESGGPVGNIECLLHPTPTRRPEFTHGALWRLVSQLSLNHLSISGGESGAETLRELLNVYDTVRASDDPFPWEGILSVENHRVVSRVDFNRGIRDLRGTLGIEPGFGRGVEVELELDEERFVGTGQFLFATVLERFFALYCSVNSFTKLVLRTRQRKELKRWPPRSGERVLL